MPVYRVPFQVQTEGTGENLMIEITFANPGAGYIRNVAINPETVETVEVKYHVELVRESVAGSGGITPTSATGGTLEKVDANSRATGATVLVKDVAVAFPVGTVSDVLAQGGFSGFGAYEYNPAMSKEKFIPVVSAGIWGLVLSSSTADKNVSGYVEWED